jgi:hypothetical protein
MMKGAQANFTAEVSMLVTPSSPIAPAFQQQLPVDVPMPVRLLTAEPAASTPRSGCSTPREFSFGLLTAFCSPRLVDRVLTECGRQERRCRLLPARLVVYALLLMCLSPELGYAKLMHHVAGLAGFSGVWAAPHKAAFVRARQRLGWEVMERLFRALARPLGEPARDHACFWRGRRVVALDGTTLELAVNPELEQAFGGQLANDGIGRRRVGPPRARLLTLAECGTRALLDAVLGHYEEGENSLARSLVRSLGPGMLLLADRGFPSKPLWKLFTEAGVDLLWRAKQGVGQRRMRELPDGSYLVRFGKGDPLTVRVIEYRLQGSGQVYRLLTNLLDPISADARELARLYSERWEVEILTYELKIRQCAGRALRSQNEIGVRQELWTHCLLHTINRQLIYRAAITIPERDPDRISFSLAQDAIRRSLHQLVLLGRRGLAITIRRAVSELSAVRARLTRRPRSYPRVVYKKLSRYGNRARHPSPGPIARPPLQIVLSRA